LEGPGIVGRIILRWIFREWVAWTRLTWLRRPLRRPRHSWKDNIKMDLQGVGGMD